MAVWSSLSRNILFNSKSSVFLLCLNKNIKPQQVANNILQVRHGGHGPPKMIIKPSRFQWDKFKTLLHFYFLLGIIPCAGIVIYTNLFIGPAKLAPIPEGYEPKNWEYYQHPITRFFARYITHNPQQEYEKMCHYLFEEKEKQLLYLLEKKIRGLISERKDYMSYYVDKPETKYPKLSRQQMLEVMDEQGD